MSRTGWNRRSAGWPARLALAMGLAIAAGLGSSASIARGQEPSTPLPVGDPAPVGTPIVAPTPPFDQVPHDVQVVRFQGPEGVKVEVLGPAPEPVSLGDGKGLATFGMKVGLSYKLRVYDLPDRPGVEIYPVVDIVGHLHRPAGIDPAKYPMRIVIRPDDIDDVAGRNLLVTQVIYLEDPDLAIPIKLPKDEPPFVTLSPAEQPFQVARALGRVVAIVRLGGRQPIPEEGERPGRDWPAGYALPVHGPRRRWALQAPLRPCSVARPRLQAGPGCLATNSSAMVATEASRSTSAAMADSPGSTPATPRSSSTRETGLGSCRPTSSASTHQGSPRFERPSGPPKP